MINETLLSLLKRRFKLPWDGIHGISHWTRVWKIGSELAARNGADIKVVEAFAFLHDSCRISDKGDHRHGLRAANLVGELNDKNLGLGIAQLALLQYACAYHETGKITGNITIGTCWDADRLDLGRIGIYPDSEYLSTHAARAPEFIERAYSLSGGDMK